MPELARVQFGQLHQLARDVREVSSLGLQEAQDRLGCARKRERSERAREEACARLPGGAAGRVCRCSRTGLPVQQDGSGGCGARTLCIVCHDGCARAQRDVGARVGVGKSGRAVKRRASSVESFANGAFFARTIMGGYASEYTSGPLGILDIHVSTRAYYLRPVTFTQIPHAPFMLPSPLSDYLATLCDQWSPAPPDGML